MQRLRQFGRAILEQMDYRINRFLGYTYWLHIGDVLTPCNGKMTAGQYIVASRVLDIERIRAGLDPVWQNKLSEMLYDRISSSREIEMSNERFKRLVCSIDKSGLNPNIAKLFVSDNPLVLNNGTHRIAYCALLNSNTYLPFMRDRHDLKPWFPLDGEGYWRKLGLPDKDIRQLANRYSELLSTQVRTEITAYVKNEYSRQFCREIEKNGEVLREYSIDGGAVYRIQLYKQWLYSDKQAVKSKYIEQLSRDMDNTAGNVWGWIAHTVTESIALENLLEERLSGEFPFA